jgi:hypothetical protein
MASSVSNINKPSSLNHPTVKYLANLDGVLDVFHFQLMLISLIIADVVGVISPVKRVSRHRPQKIFFIFVLNVQNGLHKESATPNKHLHCHLAECIKEYGPIHYFWLFSFERYNGILEGLPTNNRALEIQLMWRFVKGDFLINSPYFTGI